MPGKSGTWIAFDYGAWRMGIAVGEQLIGTARPLITLAHRNAHQIEWQAIADLLGEWQPVGLVLGWPITDDGRTYPVADFIRRFGRRLQGRFNLPVFYVDERLSSAQAELALNARHGRQAVKKNPGLIDSQAAAIILDTFFSQNLDTAVESVQQP